MSRKTEKRSMMLLRPIRQDEEFAKQEFARTRGEVQAMELRISRCNKALAVHDEFARRAILAGGEAAGLGFYRQCVGQLRDELMQAREQLDRMNVRLQSQRQELVRLMKQRKAFEQLIERLKLGRAASESRLASKELDQVDSAQRNWRLENAAASPLDPTLEGNPR